MYFLEENDFLKLWGKTPETDFEHKHVAVGDISAIEESRFRLPAKFANEVYRAGESGMGWFDFTLVFTRWCWRNYMVGSFIDFLEYPLWFGPKDVRAVVLYRRKLKDRGALDTYWCVFRR